MDSFLGDLFNDGGQLLSPVLLVPVLFVIVGAILVFTLGFKKPTEPQFKKIAASDASAKKTTKRKEKQPTIVKSTPNGSLTAAQPPAVKKPPTQPAAASKRDAKSDSLKTKDQSSSPKKSLKTIASKKPAASKPEKVRKPADFDDGEWTKVPSRTDKKKKLDDLIIAQVLDAAVPKKSTDKKAAADQKPTKNTKQLKDEENKFKKEAAKVNKKTKLDNAENNQDRIQSEFVAAKKLDSDIFAEPKTEPFVAAAATAAAEEKSDDNKQVSAGIVFDEMEDTWTEAKAPKKGKKKSRKE